jgi:hypothetical protein
MSLEIAWKQSILVTDFHLLKSLLVVFGFGLQAFICDFSRQNIFNVMQRKQILTEISNSFVLSLQRLLLPFRTVDMMFLCWMGKGLKRKDDRQLNFQNNACDLVMFLYVFAFY